MQLITDTFAGDFEWDAANDGSFTALIARFGEVNRNGAMYLPGAFGKQDGVLSPYNHSSMREGALPVGEGVTEERGKVVVVNGRYYLDGPDSETAYNRVKSLGKRAQWSFGFTIEKAKAKLAEGGKSYLEVAKIGMLEFSPVLMGANRATGTLSINSVLTDMAKDLVPEEPEADSPSWVVTPEMYAALRRHKTEA